MAKDTTAKDTRTREQLDRDVEAAQVAVLEAPKAETEAERRARIDGARKARQELDRDVAAAQRVVVETTRQESQADRDARIAKDREAVRQRQRDVVAAVDAENAARAKALGLVAPAPSPDAEPA